MAMLLAPSTAVVGFTPYQSVPVPRTAVATAKMIALRVLMSPRTRGRLRVRDIWASYAGSRSMFRVLADAMVPKVPVVRKKSVKVDKDGV